MGNPNDNALFAVAEICFFLLFLFYLFKASKEYDSGFVTASTLSQKQIKISNFQFICYGFLDM